MNNDVYGERIRLLTPDEANDLINNGCDDGYVSEVDICRTDTGAIYHAGLHFSTDSIIRHIFIHPESDCGWMIVEFITGGFFEVSFNILW